MNTMEPLKSVNGPSNRRGGHAYERDLSEWFDEQ